MIRWATKQWWRFLHNCAAHPLLFVTGDSSWSIQFHDWTSSRMHDQYPKIYKRIETPSEIDRDQIPHQQV